MAKDAKLTHLANVRLFSALSSRELTKIGRVAEEITVPGGKVLVKEGDPGHEFFLILDGQATVKKGNRKVATLGPGQYFGELALLDRAPRNATVVSDMPMTLAVLGQREFSGVLDEIPGLAHKIMRSMASRLREADAKAVSS